MESVNQFTIIRQVIIQPVQVTVHREDSSGTLRSLGDKRVREVNVKTFAHKYFRQNGTEKQNAFA